MNILQTTIFTIGILGCTGVLSITAKDLSKQRLNSQVGQLKSQVVQLQVKIEKLKTEVATLQQVVDICSKVD